MVFPDGSADAVTEGADDGMVNRGVEGIAALHLKGDSNDMTEAAAKGTADGMLEE